MTAAAATRSAPAARRFFFIFRRSRLNAEIGRFENIGVDFGKTDFAAVAKALGGRGVDVESRDALRQAVEEGLAADTRVF